MTSDFSASGFCAKCKTVHSLPEGNSRRYALELIEQLESHRRIDFDSGEPNEKFSTDYLWSDARGQMFGVLECKNAGGETIILRAFSGQYNGLWTCEGWVPPILNPEEFYRLSNPVDREIKQLDLEIRNQPAHESKVKRKELSQKLMKEIHALYRLTNFRGEKKLLSEIFLSDGIPTGAGDCCAPKLLNFAAQQNLTPVGLSEFYFGETNRSGTKHHKQFYSACVEKCQPLLGFMLCGLAPALEIIYSDDDIVVVNKPSGLLAVPGKGAENQDCIAARIKKLFPHCIEQPAVHRLDMDTSGLMVFALTVEAHRELSRQFHDREVEKKYIALLDGIIAGDSGVIELPFRLDVENRPRQIYDPVHGKIGITHWKKLSVKNGQTLIEFQPITGRTHQLRVHAASEHGLNTPIGGDRLYGSATAPGQLKLHSSHLSFLHPYTNKKLQFHSLPV